jgi:hypothetical protein
MPRPVSSSSLNLDLRERRPGSAVNLRTARAALGSLLVVWVGWLLLAMARMPDRFVMPPRSVHLTRQIVSLLTG